MAVANELLASVRARRGHFRMESGHHADAWLELETLCRTPSRVQPFAGELAARLLRYAPEVVCGPLNEGAFVALMAAPALDCDFTYAERFAPADATSMYAVQYRLPAALRHVVAGRRVAIVNDVVSAGSAVRGTLSDLEQAGASVVAVGSLIVLGRVFDEFAAARGLPVEALARLPFESWEPDRCPLCRDGQPLEPVSS
jgi:orotate phosphoribosyltransferase